MAVSTGATIVIESRSEVGGVSFAWPAVFGNDRLMEPGKIKAP